MARILVDNVRKSYPLGAGQEKLALKSVDLDVRDGEFVCLLGPSGCGKTTLLNILSGLETSYEGSVRFEPERPSAAYMFQEPRLLPWLTVRENLRFVLDSRSRGTEALVRQWLERVGLVDYGSYYPLQLSAGMQQRLAVARALIIQPEMLFMDEPFSALDALTALHMRRELLDLWREQDCTVVFVTHNPLEAVHLADRVVIMSPSPGRIVDEVRIDALLPRPRDPDDPKLWDLSRRITRQLIGGKDERVASTANA